MNPEIVVFIVVCCIKFNIFNLSLKLLADFHKTWSQVKTGVQFRFTVCKYTVVRHKLFYEEGFLWKLIFNLKITLAKGSKQGNILIVPLINATDYLTSARDIWHIFRWAKGPWGSCMYLNFYFLIVFLTQNVTKKHST